MKLSHTDIEGIALSNLTKFYGALTSRVEWVKPVSIESFAEHHLGLRTDYSRLCDYGNVLSITAYTDTDIKLRQYLRDAQIHVPADTVLLDERLKKPLFPPDKELHRRRFAIAHECSHQILHRRESAYKQKKYDSRYIGKVVSLSDFLSMYNWREWQVNALAAAILMPAKYLALLLGQRRLSIYGNRMNPPDKLALANMSNRLKVSQTAMTIRLKQLGYATVLPKDAYYDPTSIECDEDFHMMLMKT